jgi:hypothetical protein
MGLVAKAVSGAVAGAIATAAMDLLLYRRYREEGGDQDLVAWEFSSSVKGFEDAPAPARLGKLVADRAGIALPDSAAAATNNAIHWITGVGWGKVAGVVAGAVPLPKLVVGLGTGVTAWGASYALLGMLGIYKPINEYDKETLWKDLSAHLVFGTAMGAALTLLDGSRRS